MEKGTTDILAVNHFHIYEALWPNGRAPMAMAVMAVVKFEAWKSVYARSAVDIDTVQMCFYIPRRQKT